MRRPRSKITATPRPRSNPGYLPGRGQLVAFDRDTWLNECSARLSTYEDSDRSQVLGGLIGAAAGGVIGNRVAGRGDRLGGTLHWRRSERNSPGSRWMMLSTIATTLV